MHNSCNIKFSEERIKRSNCCHMGIRPFICFYIQCLQFPNDYKNSGFCFISFSTNLIGLFFSEKFDVVAKYNFISYLFIVANYQHVFAVVVVVAVVVCTVSQEFMYNLRTPFVKGGKFNSDNSITAELIPVVLHCNSRKSNSPIWTMSRFLLLFI